MGLTKIQYADEVSNPLQVVDKITGKKGTHCEKPDPNGTCKECWAEVLNMRGSPDNKRFGTGLVYDKSNRDRLEWVFNEKEIARLIRLNDRKPESVKFPGNKLVVFTNDTYDLFQPSISDELREWTFRHYDLCTNLNLLIQTTYPSLMRKFLTARYPNGMPEQYVVGMSAGNQLWLSQNYRHLVAVPAQRRYIIFEPLLGPIDFDLEIGAYEPGNDSPFRQVLLEFIHWIIVGGESGPNARPMHPEWARSIRDACKLYDIPFLFKQWGEFRKATWMEMEKSGWSDRKDPSLQFCESSSLFYYGAWMKRVGKKKAGREFDGKIWNQFPMLEAAP